MTMCKVLLIFALITLCSTQRPQAHDSRCQSSFPALPPRSCRYPSVAFNRKTRRCSLTCGRGPFENLEECHAVCRSVKVCRSPRPIPQCTSRTWIVYYYSPQMGRCLAQRGCSFAGNNFPTLAECSRTCIPRRPRPVPFDYGFYPYGNNLWYYG